MKLKLSVAVVLAVVGFMTQCKAEDVLVTVQQGTLRGTTATGVYNTSYTAFRGIPFAEPPVGELRFQTPRPARCWSGVRDATRYGSDCVQQNGAGSEDCLYLNVYVPGVPQEGAQLPVFFWVFGGGFIFGGGSDQQYGPDFLVSYGVILVTVNYRLGALGFLSTRDAAAPGNAALKDQQLALRWVRRNIARFGGDPQRVTLAGQSSGGGSVSLHLVAPHSAGLFSRAIIQSGNFISRQVIADEARQHAFNLGAALGFHTNDSHALVDFLRTVNATDLLVDNSLILSDEEKTILVPVVWGPSIEADLAGAFISEAPIKVLNEGRFCRVPILTGVTSGETGFSILNQAAVIDRLDKAFQSVVGPCLHLSTTTQQADAASKLRDFYFGNGTISVDDPVPLVNFNNDIQNFEPTDAFVRKVVEVSNVPIYYYEFDYRGENVNKTQWGVTHNGELPFLFLRNGVNYNLDPNSEEDRVRRHFLHIWTNFAKHGIPTPWTDPVIWHPYNATSRNYLLMQANFTVAHDRLGERMGFWHQNVPLMPFPGTF
ncbi:juvenile hormone esterase-like [Schistocerca nitens]|uniref:juvenile hormone esterase-like n=1 Tax=Schistocerca nitens TaxID=7011 RepID=UPI00211759E6|nr:juvenile hormone esterase-like [Schistocerca nitens]